MTNERANLFIFQVGFSIIFIFHWIVEFLIEWRVYNLFLLYLYKYVLNMSLTCYQHVEKLANIEINTLFSRLSRFACVNSVCVLLLDMRLFWSNCCIWIVLLKDYRRRDENWHICDSRHTEGRASNLWLSVWLLAKLLTYAICKVLFVHSFMKMMNLLVTCLFYMITIMEILWHLFYYLLFYFLYCLSLANKLSRFVQFGADQDCHCGAVGCRRKLGVRPTKPKISSDAALKLVACQVAVSSPKLKAILSGRDVSTAV